jgi:hypothetical protein
VRSNNAQPCGWGEHFCGGSRMRQENQVEALRGFLARSKPSPATAVFDWLIAQARAAQEIAVDEGAKIGVTRREGGKEPREDRGENGFDGVGLDAIMERRGLTHGGFYRHSRKLISPRRLSDIWRPSSASKQMFLRAQQRLRRNIMSENAGRAGRSVYRDEGFAEIHQLPCSFVHVGTFNTGHPGTDVEPHIEARQQVGSTNVGSAACTPSNKAHRVAQRAVA